MFDSNLRYLPAGLNVIIFADHISKDSELYKAGARKKQKLEAWVPVDKVDSDDMQGNYINVKVNGSWIKVSDETEFLIERLEYFSPMPTAPEYFTKNNHPMK